MSPSNLHLLPVTDDLRTESSVRPSCKSVGVEHNYVRIGMICSWSEHSRVFRVVAAEADCIRSFSKLSAWRLVILSLSSVSEFSFRQLCAATSIVCGVLNGISCLSSRLVRRRSPSIDLSGFKQAQCSLARVCLVQNVGRNVRWTAWKLPGSAIGRHNMQMLTTPDVL